MSETKQARTKPPNNLIVRYVHVTESVVNYGSHLLDLNCELVNSEIVRSSQPILFSLIVLIEID